MIKLLNAAFTRLRKSKIFWILSIFSIGFALVIINTQYGDMRDLGESIEIGQLVLSYPTIIGIVIAIFISLFLGVEYSDGAIRNKISIGHRRKNIYLSNLIVSSVVSLFFYAIFLVIMIAIGIPLFGAGTIPISLILMKLLVMTLVIIAYSSIFTFVALICSNKTIISIITILLAFGMTFFSTYCYTMLTAPETIPEASMENGETKIEEVPNPKYPSPEKRKMYQTLLDIIPSGQTLQMQERDSNLEILLVYSLGILVVFTGSGLVLFNKKELK